MVSFDLCEGNPGALTFMGQAYSANPFKAENAFQRMQDNKIRGAKLYMLWNDCCNRDTEMAVNIMCENDVDDMLLLTDNGVFYEFIPHEEFGKENPKVVSLKDVELDKEYVIVITTNA